MSVLDLSGLKPVELPKKEIEIQLKDDFTVNEAGEKIPNVQKITVHAMSGAGLIAWGNSDRSNPESVKYEERACRTALVYGADLTEEQAQTLMNFDRHSANKISFAVWRLTADFHSAKNEEAKTAEKNLTTADVNTDA